MTSKNQGLVDIWTVQNAPDDPNETPGPMPNKMESVHNQVHNRCKNAPEKTVMGNLFRMMDVCRLCRYYEEVNEVGGCVRNNGQPWTRLDLLNHCPKVIQIRRN